MYQTLELYKLLDSFIITIHILYINQSWIVGRIFNQKCPKQYSRESARDQIVNPFSTQIKKASVQLAIYVIVRLFVASKGRNSTDPGLLASNNTSLAVEHFYW